MLLPFLDTDAFCKLGIAGLLHRHTGPFQHRSRAIGEGCRRCRYALRVEDPENVSAGRM